ncbi:SGNH/GDSL hydrolase family protein [Sphingomonas sp. Leaf257]|uniref:SGNH/GDSL hydrolase family protein n=1 Tax=Sphingomonas sp. Leaf257 TaxID=1736309 RepID=UPI001444382D|nr:SGNH/GDSL hydrolase family protein [Sphingomonas sp. Leaf257]
MSTRTTLPVALSMMIGSCSVMMNGSVDSPDGFPFPVPGATATPTPTPTATPTPSAGSPDRYMFAFTRLRMPSGPLVTAAADTPFVMTRIVAGSPQYRLWGVRCHFSGFASTEGGMAPQESILPGNATRIDGFWLSIGRTRVRATFADAMTANVDSGTTGVWTDEIDFAGGIPANSDVGMTTAYHTAAGEKQIPVYRIQSNRGERVWGGTDLASVTAHLDSPGDFSTASLDTGSGQAMPQYYGPDVCLGKGWDGNPVVLGAVDSIGESRQEYAVEADTRGNLGWLRKWLDTADGTYGRTPHFLIGMPGARSQYELAAGATLRWQVIDQAAAFNTGRALPFTVLVNQLGQNDLNSKFATMRANYTGFLDRFAARYPGIRVVATGVLPRTSSTDLWMSRANQTLVTGNEWGTAGGRWGTGFKWQLEAYKESGAEGRIAGYIDTRPFWYDDTAPGTWPVLSSQPSPEGVHPYAVAVTAIVGAIPQSGKAKLR